MRVRLLGCALACAFLLILPGSAFAGGGGCPSGTPQWTGGFDAQNLSEYTQYFSQFTEPGNDITFSNTTAECNYAAKFQLHNGDTAPDGTNRAQLRKSPWNVNDDRWFRLGFYIDSSTTIDGTMTNPGPWRVLAAWPDTTDGAESSYHIGLQSTNGTSATSVSNGGTPKIVFSGDLGGSTVNGDDVDYWSTAPTTNTWHDFIVHLKFANTDANGILELYYDDPSDGYGTFVKQTFNATACNSKGGGGGAGCSILHMRSVDLNSSHTNNLREGLYRNSNFTTTDTVYFDNMRSGTSFDSVGGTVQPPNAFVDDSFTEDGPGTFVEDTFT